MFAAAVYVRLARWGVNSTFGKPTSGKSSAGGSGAYTSNAAAASRFSRIAFASACAKAAGDGKPEKPEGSLAQCIRAPDPRYPKALNAAIRTQKEKPPFWRTLISEMQANIALFEQPVPSAESHAAIPLIVLSASDPFEGAPPEGGRDGREQRCRRENEAAADGDQAYERAEAAEDEQDGGHVDALALREPTPDGIDAVRDAEDG